MKLLFSNKLVLLGGIFLTTFAVTATFAPFIASYGPYDVDSAHRLEPPSWTRLMGTDNLGRDIFSRVLYGSRISLSVGLFSALLSALIGIPLGLIAGYYKDTLSDTIIMRLVDLLFAFPTVILAITIITVFGRETIPTGFLQIGFVVKIVLVLGVMFAPRYARIIRSQVVSLQEEDFVKALKVMRASDRRIMYDLLRNCQSIIIVQASLVFGIAIIIEATLSFVGLGIPPPEPSWGTMLSIARDYIFSGQWWMTLFPGLAIFLSVIGANMVGDGLRDALDPHLREMTELGG